MKRITIAFAIAMVFGCVALASAATEVKMSGDARIHANFWSQYNYTGWNAQGTKTYDNFTIWQRFRLRSDFIANESLKFRFSIRANNTPWGNGYTTVDNPAISIQVYQAYLQFKWPNTDVEFSIGMQDWGLPISSEAMFNANPVFGGTRSAAALVTVPVSEQVKVMAGFTRFLDNGAYDTTTTQQADELDGYVLAVPVTIDGFSATPWGMIAVAGRDANYRGVSYSANSNLGNNLAAAGSALSTSSRNAQNVYWWIGSSFSVTALDPFKFYADVIYGQGNANDRKSNKREGWFFDVGAEYTGFDMLTPQAMFWYSSGEDKSTGNGSERMPSVSGYWGPGNSLLFDSSQAFSSGFMETNPMGTWGVAVGLNKITFIQDLTHRIFVNYVRGTNNARALRNANTLWGTGNYVQMGRDLTDNEYVVAINFDNQYNIYENLAAIMETGWAHGEFQKSVWGRRMVNKAGDGDMFKVAFGLQYKF